MSEDKVNVIVKGETSNPEVTVKKALNHIILEDYSSATFSTDDPTSFVKFVQKQVIQRKSVLSVPVHLFGKVSDTLKYTCELWEETPSYNQKAIASLSLNPSGYAAEFLRTINRPLSLEQVNRFCKYFLRHNTDNKGLQTIIAFSQNCKFTTVTDYEQTYDNRGNYILNINKNLKDGKFAIDIPEETSFSFPIFESPSLRDRKITIPVTVIIAHHDTTDGKGKQITITFECIGATDDLMVEIESFMRTEYLTEFEDLLFIGKRELNAITNKEFIKYDPIRE